MEELANEDGHSPGVALTEKRERFVRLITQGMSNSEACRIVGINRRTGTLWRFGRDILNTAGEQVHYPPVTTSPEAERSPRYLSVDERTTIADLHRRGIGVRAIAAELGQRMAKAGLIERSPDPRDGRATRIRLSAHARNVLPQALKLRAATDSAATTDLSANEIHLLHDLLRRVMANLDTMIDSEGPGPASSIGPRRSV